MQNVINAIKAAGWQVEIESTDTTRMPIDIIAVNEEQSIPLRLYTWAIVKSGRRERSKIS